LQLRREPALSSWPASEPWERLPGQQEAALLLRLAQEAIHVDCEVLEEEK
jgi:hypothetical protein